MTDLSLASLEAMVKELVRKDEPITLRPTQLIIPGPVRQWLDEHDYTHEDVLAVVKEAYAPLEAAKKGGKINFKNLLTSKNDCLQFDIPTRRNK